MAWIQISCIVEKDRVALIEAALENAGALAISLGDAADEPQLEPPPGATPLWSVTRLTALFPDEPRTLASIRTLSRPLAGQMSIEPKIQRIQDQVWERVWLDDFAPRCFGRRLWVCPVGQTVSDPGAVVVELDPGLAFGTGHHPTTALCLRWLDAADVTEKTVVDYGCGSGILAIAALRLGAGRALAVDRDPQALEATRANAHQNRVIDRLVVCTPEDMPTESGHLLLSNILAEPLTELAPRLAELVRPHGHIALSGILFDQVAQIEAAYAHWFELSTPRIEDEWALLGGHRRAELLSTAYPRAFRPVYDVDEAQARANLQ